MYVIGITGASGSGKTTTLDMFRRLGCYTIDSDEVYHRLLLGNKELRREILDHFPTAGTEEGIDRRALAGLVYSDPEKLALLNSITHKYILASLNHMLEIGRRHEARFAFIDATLLFESGFQTVCDLVIGIIAPLKNRIARITQRDGLTEEQAMARIRVQQNDEFYTSRCDIIIENSGSDAALKDQVVRLYDRLSSSSIKSLKKSSY